MPGDLVSYDFSGGQISERTHHYDMVGEVTSHCSSAALAVLHLPLIIISTSLAMYDGRLLATGPTTLPRAPLTNRDRHDIARRNDERDPDGVTR
jgi:hypothetical protein